MLYLDYSRKHGEWIPNQYGGNENLEAIDFLRQFNEEVYSNYPDVQTIAEESTAWPMVSRPIYVGGLGFGLKWDMGWMHDTLNYMPRTRSTASIHHNSLTFRDAVRLHGELHPAAVARRGGPRQGIAARPRCPATTGRSSPTCGCCSATCSPSPGKKLLFMGGEFGQWRRVVPRRQPGLAPAGIPAAPRRDNSGWSDLNRLYRQSRPCYELDFDPAGFEWIDCTDVDHSVVSFFRRGKSTDDIMLVVANFTPETRLNYRVGAPRNGYWQELLNGDAPVYGGSGQGNMGGLETSPIPYHGYPDSLNVTLPPLATVFFKSPGQGR